MSRTPPARDAATHRPARRPEPTWATVGDEYPPAFHDARSRRTLLPLFESCAPMGTQAVSVPL